MPVGDTGTIEVKYADGTTEYFTNCEITEETEDRLSFTGQKGLENPEPMRRHSIMLRHVVSYSIRQPAPPPE